MKTNKIIKSTKYDVHPNNITSKNYLKEQSSMLPTLPWPAYLPGKKSHNSAFGTPSLAVSGQQNGYKLAKL